MLSAFSFDYESIFPVINQSHIRTDDFPDSCLSITHLIVQMAVPLLLKNRVEEPVAAAVKLFGLHDGGLCISAVSESGHDENRGDTLGRAVFMINDPYGAYCFFAVNDVVIEGERLMQAG